MGFIVYDLVFLALFTLGVFIFLYTRKHNLQRQGILFLYRTKFGIKFIDKFAKRFSGVLKPMEYIVIASGYILMISITWLFGKSIYLYLKSPLARELLGNTPPIVPLIPYAPKLFGLESLFPPLYFTYFIIALAIVAISHEFAHGIFARLHNFKIHATGFAFLGPILGAFVEPDEKQMAKAKKFPQLSILAAGTFANVIMTIIFGVILALFFSSLFVPAGVKFNTYAVSEISVAGIGVIGNSSIQEGLIEIEVDGVRFFTHPRALQQAIDNDRGSLLAFDDSPAFREQLRGAITEIDGMKITSYDDLVSSLGSHNPGDKIIIKTAILENGRDSDPTTESYEIELEDREGRAFLGIGFLPINGGGVIGFLYEKTTIRLNL